MFSYYFQSCLKRARNFQPLFKTVFLVGLLLLLLCNPQRFFEGWSILVLQYTYPLGLTMLLGPSLILDKAHGVLQALMAFSVFLRCLQFLCQLVQQVSGCSLAP